MPKGWSLPRVLQARLACLRKPSAAVGYAAAVLLAAAAQAARLPLRPPTLIPCITYIPFVVLAAAYGGAGPGLLATGLCVLESTYFAIDPLGSFAVHDPQAWLGLGTLLFTGVVIAILFERVKRARLANSAAGEMAAQLSFEQHERHRMLEAIIQNSPTCIALLRGPEFIFEAVNPAYAGLLPGETMLGRTVAEVWPEAASLILPLLSVVRDAQTAYSAAEVLIPRRSAPLGPAEQRYFDFSYVPLSDPGGEVRVMAVAVEVTRYKRVEEELRAAHQELASVYAGAPVLLLVVDDKFRVHKVNDVDDRLARWPVPSVPGLRPGDVFGCLDGLTDPRGCGAGPACAQCAMRMAVLDTARNGTRHENVEVWLPPSAESREPRRCLLISTAPRQLNGARKVLVCAYDVTPLKSAEAATRQSVRELESALAQKTVLLQEVHHRVKNNLSVISSLLAMKAGVTEVAETRLALEDSRRRVHSIALIHEHLYGAERLDRVDFLEYTQQLVQQLCSALLSEPERIAIRLEVAPVEMAVHRAVPCALLLNELLTNAFKHAFPQSRCGEIVVSLGETSPGYLELAVEDNGIGAPPVPERRNSKSLGLKIAGILARQLDGTFERQPGSSGGTRFVLRFPVESTDPQVVVR